MEGRFYCLKMLCIGFVDMCAYCVLSHEAFVLLILGVRDQVQTLPMLSHTPRHQDSVLCLGHS